MSRLRFAWAVIPTAIMPTSAIAQTSGVPQSGEPASPAQSTPVERQTPRRVWKDVEQMLDSRVPEVDFRDAPLEEVLHWVEQYTGALVYTHWGALEDSGIGRDTPVTVRAKDRPLWLALWVIMNEAEGGTRETLAYKATTESILISTHRDLSRRMIVRVYDVRDVAIDVPTFAWESGKTLPQEGTIARTIVDRAADSESGSEPGYPVARVVVGKPNEAERMQEITELIRVAVETESWAVNGLGGRGTIFPYKGRLVVRNSLYVHQIIGGLVRAAAAGGTTEEPVASAKSTEQE
jgi:hypothetical protein